MAMDRAELRALIQQKDEMEKEIMDLNDALTADNLGGVGTPVIDGEGFPRADIDVHTTLTLRNRLVRLNNDHKALMLRIEHGLTGVLPPAATRPAAPPRPAPPPAAPPPSDTGATLPPPAAPTAPTPMEVVDISELTLASDEPIDPFAEIDEVAPDGPAAGAGVRVGDLLIRFGHLHARNHNGLRALAQLTQRSVGSNIGLLVQRAVAAEGGGGAGRTEHVRLQLQPRRWAGNGLLGCHLRPL